MAERVLYRARVPQPPRPDVSADLDRYRAWIADREAVRNARRDMRARRRHGVELAVSVLLVAPDHDSLQIEWFRRCLRSLANQSHPGWELVLAGVPDDARTRAALRTCLGRSARRRVVQVSRPGTERGGAAGACRAAFEASSAPFVLLLGPHDELAPDAVSLLVANAPAHGFVYADEDELDPLDRPVAPRLKPDWSPELLLSTPYLGRPVLLARSLLTACGGISSDAGDEWEHDLLLRAGDQAQEVVHVPEVLCHRRPDGTPSGSGEAVQAALARRGEGGTVEPGPLPRTWQIRRAAGGRPRVSIIVPFRDGPRFLRTCVDSVEATADGVDFEWILVDNGSVEPETFTLLERLSSRLHVSVLHDPRPFNWAALNNAAAARATGEVLVFLNNDVEARRDGWLAALVAQAIRTDVGAVGARLLYPTGQLQHAGIVVGLGGAAGHVLAGLPSEDPGYLGMAVLARDCSAVTGACMAVARDRFDELGGFDEDLGLDLNDVDFCLRARERGYRILYEPQAELVHYESPSRGTSGSVPDIVRFVERWEPAIRRGDPFLNPNLSRRDGSCALRDPDEAEQWEAWRQSLGKDA